MNEFKPESECDLGSLKGEVFADVTKKLSKIEERAVDLTAKLTKQSKAAQDNSNTLQDLLVRIENLGDNIINMQKEMVY